MKKRNQNDAVVKAIGIRTEEHLLTILNYTNKEDESENLTTIREDDLLKNINRHRQIEHKKKKSGGRKALLAKQFIISYPPEFTEKIDELNFNQKQEILKTFIKNLIIYIKKIEPDIDVQDLANSLNADIHNDTEKRHIHLIQMNTIRLKDGTIKRLDLGKKGYLLNLKSSLFESMKKIKPDEIKELTREELNELRKKASKKNAKYMSSYKIHLKGLNPEIVEKNIKFIKKLDRKLTQFNNFQNKSNISPETLQQGINQFYKDISELIAKSYDKDIKNKYTEELNKLKDKTKDKRA